VSLRDLLRRSATARALYHGARTERDRLVGYSVRGVTYERLPAALAVRLAYEVMLQRPVDPVGLTDNLARLVRREFTRAELTQALRGSEEFQTLGFTGRMLGYSIHAGRCLFIKSLPEARRILDLGGYSLGFHALGLMTILSAVLSLGLYRSQTKSTLVSNT